MVEMDNHRCHPNNRGNLPSQDINLLVHTTHAKSDPHLLKAPDLWCAGMPSCLYPGIPPRLGTSMQALQGGLQL